MGDFKSYRDHSKTNWGRDYPPGGAPTDAEIQLGAILRIADATELMAKRHNELLSEIDRLKSSLASARNSRDWFEKQASANKGQATKWRNKFNTLKPTA